LRQIGHGVEGFDGMGIQPVVNLLRTKARFAPLLKQVIKLVEIEFVTIGHGVLRCPVSDEVLLYTRRVSFSIVEKSERLLSSVCGYLLVSRCGDNRCRKFSKAGISIESLEMLDNTPFNTRRVGTRQCRVRLQTEPRIKHLPL